jgi:RNA polymerase sigma factor (sigma-70 family)
MSESEHSEGMEALRETGVDALAAKYQRRVYQFCRSLLSRDADAEDAAQNVFLTVARRREELPDILQPLPWLLQIARLTCLNMRRERDRQPAPSAEIDAPVKAGPPIAPTESLDRLREVLQKLPERYRTVLALHYQQGLSHEEMAGVLGLSRGALRVLLHRAVTRLREEAKPS